MRHRWSVATLAVLCVGWMAGAPAAAMTTATTGPDAAATTDEQTAAATTVGPAEELIAAHPDAQVVTLLDDAVHPAIVEVTLGATVIWSVEGTAPQGVTEVEGTFASSPGCAEDPTACLAPGEAFAHTFDSAGTFEYVTDRPGPDGPLSATVVVASCPSESATPIGDGGSDAEGHGPAPADDTGTAGEGGGTAGALTDGAAPEDHTDETQASDGCGADEDGEPAGDDEASDDEAGGDEVGDDEDGEPVGEDGEDGEPVGEDEGGEEPADEGEGQDGGPDTPAEPEDPDTPTQPDDPEQPGDGEEPETPTEPGAPAEPEQPVSPTEPGDPDTPPEPGSAPPVTPSDSPPWPAVDEPVPEPGDPETPEPGDAEHGRSNEDTPPGGSPAAPEDDQAAPAGPPDGWPSTPSVAQPTARPRVSWSTSSPATVSGATAGRSRARGFPEHLQAKQNSVVRTGSNSTEALLDLGRTYGLDEAATVDALFGSFPVGGKATWSHDWWFPRFGPSWRLHEGTDVFAAHGTPVRAPADGIVRISHGDLGGLSVKVIEPDGTMWYLAHLSGTAPGLTEGARVRAGETVGFVGNSGNARTTPPHLHIGVYPQGGEPTDPKPLLDAMVDRALAEAPAVLAAEGGLAVQPERAVALHRQPAHPSAAAAGPEVPGSERRGEGRLPRLDAVRPSGVVLEEPTLIRSVGADSPPVLPEPRRDLWALSASALVAALATGRRRLRALDPRA